MSKIYKKRIERGLDVHPKKEKVIKKAVRKKSMEFMIRVFIRTVCFRYELMLLDFPLEKFNQITLIWILNYSSVNGKIGSGDPSCQVGGQKQNEPGDILGNTHPFQRDGLGR